MVTLQVLLVCLSFLLSPSSAKNSFAGQTSSYSPFPVPTDPSASPTTTSRVTVNNNTVIASKKGDQAQLKALFDQHSFRSFNMEITSTNLGIMNLDPTQEARVHCRFTIDYNTPQARTWSGFGVGCGIKGSVGSLRICVDEYHRWNGNCRHLSYRVDANAFHVASVANKSDDDFYGAKTLAFGGMPVDYAMMSERTAFRLFDDIGIAAPLTVHAKLFINGKYQGVFSFVQEVDSAFTKMHFHKDNNNGKGSVYKELWFNPLHMQELSKPGRVPQKHDGFMRSVMAAIEACPMTQSAAMNFFNTYFDVKAFVDSTALNTLMGATDDWRLRHNFFWYVREDKQGTKLVFIPWDYDRLDDAGSGTRALGGKAWWDIAGTTQMNVCMAPVYSAAETAKNMGGTPAMIAYNTDMYNQFPPDLTIPVTCDKITQLMAIALGPLIRQATLDLAGKVSTIKIQNYWNSWNPQISTAVSLDPAGPNLSKMYAWQTTLLNYFTTSTAKALSQVRNYNLNPTIVPPSNDDSNDGWVIPSNAFTSTPLPPPIKSSLPPATKKFATPLPASSTTTTFPTITFGLPASSSPFSFPSSSTTSTSFPSFGSTTSSFGTTSSSFGTTSFPATSSFGSTTSFASTPSFGSTSLTTPTFGLATSFPSFSTGF